MAGEQQAELNALNEKVAKLEIERDELKVDNEALEKKLSIAESKAQISARMASSGLSKNEMKEVDVKVSAGLSEEDAIQVVLTQKESDSRTKQKKGDK